MWRARTGPTPGRASSCCSVAELRLSGPLVSPDVPLPAPPPPPVAPPAPGGPPAPAPPVAPAPSAATRICSPSVSSRARFSPRRSAPRNTPPAACSASITREPAGNRCTPGRWTFPATSTTSIRPAPPGGPSVAGPLGEECADDHGGAGERAPGPGAGTVRSTPGARTGSGRPAQKCWTAKPTATTSTRASAPSAFGVVPHRNCTQSGSRSCTADHQRSCRRAPGGSCSRGGGARCPYDGFAPASDGRRPPPGPLAPGPVRPSALPSSLPPLFPVPPPRAASAPCPSWSAPKIAAARARVRSRFHSRTRSRSRRPQRAVGTAEVQEAGGTAGGRDGPAGDSGAETETDTDVASGREAVR
ncbi:hypothetical protein GZL_05835 [Streptomyces sp. 769]|nr:hypothetical protein GZL_05835 [Streptomyces sp. 769]